jgi:hypothetical protein
VHELVGQEVREDRCEKHQTGHEFAAGQSRQRNIEIRDESKQPHRSHRPAVALIKPMARGAHAMRCKPPAFKPTVRGVSEPHGYTEDERLGPADLDTRGARKEPLPENNYGGCIKREYGGPLPPARVLRS